MACGPGVRYDGGGGVCSTGTTGGLGMERERVASWQFAVAVCAAAVTAGVTGGCGRHAAAGTGQVSQPATMPANAPTAPVFAASAGPSTRPIEFVSTAKGVRLESPQGWKPVPSSDYVLLLV